MATMEFASFDEAVYNWFDSAPQAADVLERSIREVQMEEKVGFKYHFIIEHQGHVVGQIQSPAVYLAAVAQHTSTIRLGAMVFLLPFYNPLRLAMDASLVDQLSRGRLEFGAGVAGGSFDSFKSWNVHFPPAERREAGAEALEVIQKAWTEDRFSYEGKYYRYEGAISMPRPYQKPHPPIWFAGATKTSLELCVSRGYGVGVGGRNDKSAAVLNQWKQMWKDSGQKGPRPPSFIARSVYVAETDEQAYEEAAIYLPQSYTWGDQKFPNKRLGEEKDLENTEAASRRMELRQGQRSGLDYWIENEIADVGSPETVIRSIEKSQKLVGYDVFGGTFRHGPMPEDLVMKNLKLFGEKVMPAFTDVKAPVIA